MNAVFMIEGGRALEMVREHIAERQRVAAEVSALADELGVEQVTRNRMTGVLLGVVFPKTVHKDFTKPSRRTGVSYPKKGTEWAKRLRAQIGYRDPSEWISEEFGVPLSIDYECHDGSSGWSGLGNPLTECGFLYPAADGPYALWIPDVPAEVAEREARGCAAKDPAKSFRLESLEAFGCRRIEQEEWEITVLQHKLAAKKGAAA